MFASELENQKYGWGVKMRTWWKSGTFVPVLTMVGITAYEITFTFLHLEQCFLKMKTHIFYKTLLSRIVWLNIIRIDLISSHAFGSRRWRTTFLGGGYFNCQYWGSDEVFLECEYFNVFVRSLSGTYLGAWRGAWSGAWFCFVNFGSCGTWCLSVSSESISIGSLLPISVMCTLPP